MDESSDIDLLAMRRQPEGLPLMHQNWAKLLFMHWRIDAKLLRPLIPFQLEIDTFDDSAWIGVVPFTMWGIRASFLPPVPGTTAFHELNVRTYVHHRGVPSVWFLSLDAANKLAVWGARKFYCVPYFYAQMSLEQTGNTIRYSSSRNDRGGAPAEFHATWNIGEVPGAQASLQSTPRLAPSSLEFFLTERYCLDTVHNGKHYRARIHHEPWPLQRAQLISLNSSMIESHGLPTPQGDLHLLYSEEIRVAIWPLKKV
jgi:uncharacterized protein YqjF (DUF2071 family)